MKMVGQFQIKDYKIMRKIISIILILTLCIGIMSLLVACENTGNGDGSPSDPIYASEYTYNDTHHWYAQTNGDGLKDYEEHYNPTNGQSHGKCKCGYYFPCHNLVYRKITLNGVLGYEVYDYDEYMSPNFYHVEVPKFYQGEDDAEPLPVISIAQYALSNRPHEYYENGELKAYYGRCDIRIESIKLNEGLMKVDTGAFCYTNIKEIVIPDSVTNDLLYTFMYCPMLKRIVIGDGVTRIKSYTFCNSNVLEEVVLGSSVREILDRNFIGNGQLKRVVIPKSLISIPEGVFYNGNVAGEAQVKMFSNNPDLFFEITAEEYDEITIPRKPRDPATGKPIPPYTDDYTTYGWVEGWDGNSKKYFDGEWHYDENGVPTPNS